MPRCSATCAVETMKEERSDPITDGPTLNPPTLPTSVYARAFNTSLLTALSVSNTPSPLVATASK